MKPIKKWSKFVAWAMRDIGKDLRLKVYAFHNDPQRKTYVAIGEGYCNLYIMAFTEVVTKKKGNYEIISGFRYSTQVCEYKRFRSRAIDQVVARTPRSTIKLHIAACIEQSQPVVRFEDGSKIEPKRMEHLGLIKSRAKINEILTDYLI